MDSTQSSHQKLPSSSNHRGKPATFDRPQASDFKLRQLVSATSHSKCGSAFTSGFGVDVSEIALLREGGAACCMLKKQQSATCMCGSKRWTRHKWPHVAIEVVAPRCCSARQPELHCEEGSCSPPAHYAHLPLDRSMMISFHHTTARL
jgi:hypothetical protein